MHGFEVARARAEGRERVRKVSKKVARSQPGNLSRIGSLLQRQDLCSPPCNHRESVAAAANYVS